MAADYSRKVSSKLTLNHSMLQLKLGVCRESPCLMLTRLFCSGQMSADSWGREGHRDGGSDNRPLRSASGIAFQFVSSY